MACVGLFLFFVYTTILLFRKSRRFPRFFIWQFVAVIFTPFVAILWVAATVGAVAADAALNMSTKEVGQIIEAVIGAAIWIPYVLRSRRVRNTFVEYS
jgi:cytosine/uracil/thiamine/allantoin permease